MRLLTVGDGLLGGQEIHRARRLKKACVMAGFDAEFPATGQTRRVSSPGAAPRLNAVVADFISGAVEWISPKQSPDHWDLIEGGITLNPSFARASRSPAARRPAWGMPRRLPRADPGATCAAVNTRATTATSSHMTALCCGRLTKSPAIPLRRHRGEHAVDDERRTATSSQGSKRL